MTLINRSWATPLTIGAFFLMSVTGILMFFHLDTGLAKPAHEWLGWAMVAGVFAHVAANSFAFKRHLQLGYGRWIILVFMLLTGAALLAPEEENKNPGNPAMRVTQTVVALSLNELALVVKKDPAVLIKALQNSGFSVSGAEQSIAQIAGDKRGHQFRALTAVWEAN